MNTFAQLLAFGTGALILVVALTLGGMFASATRYVDNGQGCLVCLGLFICSTFLSIAGLFFSMAFTA